MYKENTSAGSWPFCWVCIAKKHLKTVDLVWNWWEGVVLLEFSAKCVVSVELQFDFAAGFAVLHCDDPWHLCVMTSTQVIGLTRKHGRVFLLIDLKKYIPPLSNQLHLGIFILIQVFIWSIFIRVGLLNRLQCTYWEDIRDLLSCFPSLALSLWNMSWSDDKWWVTMWAGEYSWFKHTHTPTAPTHTQRPVV